MFDALQSAHHALVNADNEDRDGGVGGGLGEANELELRNIAPLLARLKAAAGVGPHEVGPILYKWLNVPISFYLSYLCTLLLLY